MKTLKKAGEGILLAGIIFLLTILLFENRLQIPAWLKVAGRMHPMFLHFPIVLLLLSLISVWIPTHEEKVGKWFWGLRLVAALSAVVTAIMGFILSVEEERSGSVLQWHKWGGIAVAVFGFAFYYLSPAFLQRRTTAKIFAFIATFTIIATGHWGAVLTHGDNYLLAPVANENRIPPDQALVYRDIIRPVLEKKCVGCHGEANVKGGLLLNDMAGILKGGKTGPLFVPGAPELSLLIERIHLPPDEKKHMPPKSKPALSDDEVSLLYYWVKSGALFEKKLTTMPARDSFRMFASRFLGSPDETEAGSSFGFKSADNKLIASLNTNYRSIEPLGMGSPALAVQFYGRSNYSPGALEELLPIKQQITELSLARMPVTDDDLESIKQFANLEKLNLNYTDVTGKGLEYLSSLKKLKQLSLSGTKVNASALQKLTTLPQLAQIFIWDTPVDSSHLKELRIKHRNITFESGFTSKADVVIALSPPVISMPAGIIDRDTVVEIKHPFKDVEIRYTLDGMAPDSVSGEIYKKDIPISRNTVLTARAFKKGWFGSRPAVSRYIRRTYKPDSILLITPPDQRYNGEAALLLDGDLADLNTGNGKWLGYNKNEASYYLEFKEPVTVSQVLLNMLENTGGGIFRPSKIEVWGGLDKQQLQPLGKMNFVMPVKNEPSKVFNAEILFEARKLRHVKIIAQPLKALPPWHNSKGNPGWVFVSEIALN